MKTVIPFLIVEHNPCIGSQLNALLNCAIDYIMLHLALMRRLHSTLHWVIILPKRIILRSVLHLSHWSLLEENQCDKSIRRKAAELDRYCSACYKIAGDHSVTDTSIYTRATATVAQQQISRNSWKILPWMNIHQSNTDKSSRARTTTYRMHAWTVIIVNMHAVIQITEGTNFSKGINFSSILFNEWSTCSIYFSLISR